MYLFVGSCIKTNCLYVLKHLAHGEFLFPTANGLGLKDAWMLELRAVLKYFCELQPWLDVAV